MLKYASEMRYDFVVDKCGRLPVVTAILCVRLHSLISGVKNPGGTRQSNATNQQSSLVYPLLSYYDVHFEYPHVSLIR